MSKAAAVTANTGTAWEIADQIFTEIRNAASTGIQQQLDLYKDKTIQNIVHIIDTITESAIQRIIHRTAGEYDQSLINDANNVWNEEENKRIDNIKAGIKDVLRNLTYRPSLTSINTVVDTIITNKRASLLRPMPEVPEKIMPGFIQALYGVVIGIGSLAFLKSIRELKFYPLLPDTNRVAGMPAGQVSGGELLFRFIFFAFTVLIVAHDWYTYHKHRIKKNKDPFWSHAPQLGSLFFLGQMLNSSINNEMLPWFVWGFIYTCFNFLNSTLVDFQKEEKKRMQWSYVIHFAICIIAVIVLLCYRQPGSAEFNPRLWKAQIWILSLTMPAVLWIWHRKEYPDLFKRENWPKKKFFPQLFHYKKGIVPFYLFIILFVPFVLLTKSFFPAAAIPNSSDKKYENNSVSLMVDMSRQELNTEPLANAIRQVEKKIIQLRGIHPKDVPDSLLPAIHQQLDTILAGLYNLINQQQEILYHLNNRNGDKTDSLYRYMHQLANRDSSHTRQLQELYLTDIAKTLNKAETELGKLKGRLQRKSPITKEDIFRLRNQLDSIRALCN